MKYMMIEVNQFKECGSDTRTAFETGARAYENLEDVLDTLTNSGEVRILTDNGVFMEILAGSTEYLVIRLNSL